jgi:hypothetical protein
LEVAASASRQSSIDAGSNELIRREEHLQTEEEGKRSSVEVEDEEVWRRRGE